MTERERISTAVRKLWEDGMYMAVPTCWTVQATLPEESALFSFMRRSMRDQVLYPCIRSIVPARREERPRSQLTMCKAAMLLTVTDLAIKHLCERRR